MVTDTLTVKVGYYGMAADKYVEAGTYHWTELMDNLPLHIQTGDAWYYAVEVVQEPQELDGTIGSHTAQLTLSVSDPSLLEHLQQLLEFTSSDGSVLTIDGWTVTPDARYSDLVTVSIQYTVLREGSAAINGNIGGLSLSASPQVKAPDTPETPGDSGDSGGTDTPGDPGQGDTSRENPDPNRDSTGTNRDTERILDQRAAQCPAAPKTDVKELPDGRMMIPLTAQQAAQLLQGGGNDPDTENRTGSDSAPAEQVDDMTLALLLTGAGALLLAAAGAGMQTVYYRKERNA